MSRTYGPCRRLVGDLPVLAIALACPLLLFWIFPSSALPWAEPVRRLSASPAAGVSFSFVRLSPRSEERLIAATRLSRPEDGVVGKVDGLELLERDLPAPPIRSSAAFGAVRRPDWCAPEAPHPSLLPVSLAAPPPEPLSPAATPPAAPTFPREDLLKLQ